MKNAFRSMIIALILAALVLFPAAAGPGAGTTVYLPVVAGSGAPTAAPVNPVRSDASHANRPTMDKATILVQLNGAPLSTDARTRPAPGKKIDFNSSAVKSYRAQLAALRNDFKAWLRANAPKAKVRGEFDISLNALSVELNGETLEKIASAPMVQHAEYEGLYYPTQETAVDPDLAIIQAMDAWALNGGSAANAGEGVKVAIVDTGIDINHPCFDDTGYPQIDQLGDPRFTNNKVIAARVFNMKTPSQGYTPEAIQEHGTHVAGTVACNYQTPATVDGVTIPYGISGVAPSALLGNYNVFPGFVSNARSEDIVNALEAAYADGMDVANMSLSGGSSGIKDLLSMAVDNLDEANMVVAVAAGNEGPGHYTVGSPGIAARALTAGASTVPHFVGNARSEDIVNALDAAYADGMDVANMRLSGGSSGIKDLLSMAVDNLDEANMVVAVAAGNSGPGHYTIESPGLAARALTAGASTVPHFVGTPVTVGGNSYGAAAGDFATVESDLTAPLGVVAGTGTSLSTACSALAADLTGKIALVARGDCTFSTKIRNAQDAGAVAVLVANNVLGDPTAMGQDGTPNQPTAPAYMVSKDDGAALMGFDGQDTTISASLQYFQTSNVDIMAGFSSQGPTDVDYRVKPDVVAPGVNVLSSIPISFCDGNPCFAFFQGTSMATPHLAGSAAFLRGLHPDWTAAQVRSAVVNTAEKDVLKQASDGETATDVNVIGAGRENLLLAAQAAVALDPVSVSFGAVPSGAGQALGLQVTLTNLGDSEATFDLAVEPGDGGVTFSVSPASLTLAAGASGTVTVGLAAEKGAAGGDHQAWLTVSSGGQEVAHAAVYTFIK